MIKKVFLFKIVTLFTILLIYFIGFSLREVSNGAAHTDLQLHIWQIIGDFKSDFI